MIDIATIERIQQAAQIVEVVSDFIALRKSGSGYKGICPFHDDSNPSLSVSPARNIFKCFVCGEGGAPVHFVMKHEKISYPEALKYLARKYNIEVRETEMTEEQKHERDARESMVILNEFARDTFARDLTGNDEGKAVGLSYFRERGFRDDTIRKFQLGYSLEARDAFTRRALEAGYRLEYLEKTGLTVTGENNDYRADRFRGRVIFPIHSISGKVTGFGGRILLSGKIAKTAKYINSPDSEIYHKNSELYGIYFARQVIARQDRCYLVEGYTDVISMHQAGIENVVAACGTALTGNHIRLIRRLTTNITLLNDGDAAGKNASMKAIPMLLEAGMNVRIIILPEGEDPDTFARRNNAATVAQYFKDNETNFVIFKAKQLSSEARNDPSRMAQNITEIVDTIAIISDEITRLAYVKECSRITGYGEETLIRRIAEKRKEIHIRKVKDTHPVPANIAPPPDYIPPPPLPPDLLADIRSEEPLPPADSPLDRFERSILHYIIRYGEVDMANTPEEEERHGKGEMKYYKPTKPREPAPSVFTVEFIVTELESDGLTFTNPLYRQVLEEAFDRYREPGFRAEDYFKYHPNPKISSLATDILIDKYRESKIHSRSGRVLNEREKLHELVPYAVINFKKAILDRQIKAISIEIADAQACDDFERLSSLCEALNRKNELKGRIAEPLQRVVNP
jgi:DNA primase